MGITFDGTNTQLAGRRIETHNYNTNNNNRNNINNHKNINHDNSNQTTHLNYPQHRQLPVNLKVDLVETNDK